MAVATKTRPQTGTQTQQPTAAYFREQFARHPEWLEQSDNGPIIQQYKLDHGEQSVAAMKKVTANLSNLKSLLRSQAKGKVRQRGGIGQQGQQFDVPAAQRGILLDDTIGAVVWEPTGMRLIRKEYVQGKQVT